MNDLVSYQLNGNVCTITMDDGKVNSMSPSMISALGEAFDQAEQDSATVILVGREGKFSAGFDLAVMAEGAEAAANMVRAGAELSERLLKYPYPIIAACTGHGLAMGAFILLSVDYRIGIEGKFKIGLNEVKIGMTMPLFGIDIARARLPVPYFSRSVITAEIFSPSEAVAAGFLDEVLATDVLVMKRAEEKAAELAGLNMSAHKKTKLKVRSKLLTDLRKSIETEYPIK